MSLARYTCGACGAKLKHDETYGHKFSCPNRPGAPKPAKTKVTSA